jgi:threonine-phosphate decarboxylase
MSRIYDHGGTIFSVARARSVAPEQILDFSASINPLGMSHLVRTALLNSIDTLVHYPDSSHFELKQALAEYHELSPDNVTIANGSTELIYHLPGLIPGSKALLISPSFSEYAKALDQHRWQTVPFILTPENNFAIDMDKLEHALAGGIDALFIGNPGNPSGTLYPLDVVEKIYRLCTAAGTFLVLDEAFMDFCEEASAKRMIVACNNAVILRSMTKFFAIPGLRLGYALCNEALAERLNTMGGPWSVNTLALAAGVAALQDAQHNRASLEYISKERDVLIESLGRFPSLKLYPMSANYLLVEIIEGMTAGELKDLLLHHNILIRDCASFTGLSKRFFRIAVRTGEENKRLVECLGRILQ